MAELTGQKEGGCTCHHFLAHNLQQVELMKSKRHAQRLCRALVGLVWDALLMDLGGCLAAAQALGARLG